MELLQHEVLAPDRIALVRVPGTDPADDGAADDETLTRAIARHRAGGRLVVAALEALSAGPENRPELAARAISRAGAEGPGAPDVWLTGLDPLAEARAAAAASGRHVLVELHRVLLGYGRAADALREGGAAVVGTGLHLEVTRPADPARTQDLDAALDADLLTNHVVLGPLLDGSYPVAARAASGLADWDHVRPGDLVAIRRRLDVLAVSHSGTRTVARSADGDRFVHAPTTPEGRAADAEGLYEILCALDNAYLGVPLLGVVPTGPGEVGDGAGLDAHVAAARRAQADGADVRGLLSSGQGA